MTIIKSVTALFIAVLFTMVLTGCAKDENTQETSGISSARTESVTETTVLTEQTSLSANETAEAFSETVSESVSEPDDEDISGFVTVESYEPVPLSKRMTVRLPEWKRENGISAENVQYCLIDGYSVISAASGKFAEDTQTSNVIIGCGDDMIEISANYITNTAPLYAIKDGILYCYDNIEIEGVKRICLSEFSLESGIKKKEFTAVYPVGSDVPQSVSSTYENIGTAEEMLEYINTVSDKWYRPESVDYENFFAEYGTPLGENALRKYVADFDKARPLKITDFYAITEEKSEKASEEAENAALNAIFGSVFYKEISDYAKDEFYFENGELKAKSESFMNEYYYCCVDTSKAPDIVITPVLIASIALAFDGENTESLLIYNMPLPDSQLEWSGTADFSVPVYVNGKGKAAILTETCQQTLHAAEIISYSNGIKHVMFSSGHTVGTSQFFIYGFRGGKAELLLHDWSSAKPAYSDCTLAVYHGFTGYKHLIFYYEDVGYCGVSGASVPDELWDIIGNDSTVSGAIPDMANILAEIVGGKYLCTQFCTFTYDGNVFTVYEDGILTEPSENEYYKGVFNIDFDSFSNAE